MPTKTGKYCIITGAAGGIGRALVQTFTSEYKGIGIDIDPIPNWYIGAHYLQADLEKLAEDLKYANEVIADIKAFLGYGELCVLINNAAVQILGGVDSLNRQDWNCTLNTNLIAPFFSVRRCYQNLRQLVVVSST